MSLSQLLSDYHAELLNLFTRRKANGRQQDPWPVNQIIEVLNNKFQVLLLNVIEDEKRNGGHIASDADAHLYSAAPKLLVACETFVKARQDEVEDRMDIAFRIAQEAIKEAKGELR